MNPLNAPLAISNLSLVTSPADALTVTPVADFELEPYESRVIPIEVVAKERTTVSFASTSFLFHRFFPCTQSLERRGRRLHATKAQRVSPTYAKDTSLTVEIGESRPSFALEWVDVPDELFVGEQATVSLRVRNTGKVAVENLQLAISEDVLRLNHGECTILSVPDIRLA